MSYSLPLGETSYVGMGTELSSGREVRKEGRAIKRGALSNSNSARIKA